MTTPTDLELNVLVPEGEFGPLPIPAPFRGVGAAQQALSDLPLLLLLPAAVLDPTPLGEVGGSEIIYTPEDVGAPQSLVRHHLILLKPPLWQTLPRALKQEEGAGFQISSCWLIQ